MDEQEFDALFERPFGREDFARVDAQWGRSATLAAALFGRTSEEFARQLLAAHPEIPAGFDLADLRDLERHLQAISGLVLGRSSDPTIAWLSPWLSQMASMTITMGIERFTVWEARREIVRRAIEHLENRRPHGGSANVPDLAKRTLTPAKLSVLLDRTRGDPSPSPGEPETPIRAQRNVGGVPDSRRFWRATRAREPGILPGLRYLASKNGPCARACREN